MGKDTVVLLGCGDIGATEEPIEAYGDLVRSTLATGDIRFGQCERLYSERGTLKFPDYGSKRAKPHLASVYTDCGFNVVSVASNHGGDWGEDALIDTVDLFQKMGMHTIGAGRNLREARKPAIVERNGVRVAFLGYCSVLREGYEATPDGAGMAPLRVHTHYEPRDFNAGVPPRVVTVPYEEDLQAMVEDIIAAKKLAHAAVLSLHWGVHYYEKVIAEYQPIVAHAAIDAGVDLILGHHAHLPKAIEVYKGKVCFYSLANFIMNLKRSPESAAKLVKKYGIKLDPAYPKQGYGEGSHRTLIAKAIFSKEGVKKVSYLPAMINKECQPEVLHRGDPRFDDMVRYIEWASEGFDHKFTAEGDEILIAS